jgi:hypothetical protein
VMEGEMVICELVSRSGLGNDIFPAFGLEVCGWVRRRTLT